MLQSLRIQNYALLDSVRADFSEGMTSITGETGTGKSLLLGGLSLILGKRADTTMVKDPNKKCIVEAYFDLKNLDLNSFFDLNELDFDNQTIIRREINQNGKSRMFVNDSPVKLSVLEDLGEQLIDIHSQQKSQVLLREEQQLAFIDAYAQNETLLIDYTNALRNYKKVEKELKMLLEDYVLDEKSIALNKHLLEELQKAELHPNLKKQIQEELSEFTYAEDIKKAMANAINLIDYESVGLGNKIIELQSQINILSEKSTKYDELFNRINAIRAEVEDIGFELRGAIDGVEVDYSKIEDLDGQLSHLDYLETKHSVNSLEQLIEKQSELEEKLIESQKLTERLECLKKRSQRLVRELESLALSLRSRRKKTIPSIVNEIEGLLAQMGMKSTQLKIELIPEQGFTSSGKDAIKLLIQTNKGNKFMPLKKVVSGGELSRIMLAIKTVIAGFKNLPTIIFDEIDTGVSGKISVAVADVMKRLSKHMQVLTITHLPQVAAVSDSHFKVIKTEQHGSTITNLQELSFQERVDEIASMLSGKQISITAREHALVLLNKNQ